MSTYRPDQALAHTTSAIKEMIGLGVYRFRGPAGTLGGAALRSNCRSDPARPYGPSGPHVFNKTNPIAASRNLPASAAKWLE